METYMLQNTSNISYQSLPISDYNELEEVVINSTDKTEVAAIQLFMEQKAILKEHNDKISTFPISYVYSFFGTAPGIVGGSLLHPLWFFTSIPGIIGGVVSCKNTYEAIATQNEISSILLECFYLEGFHDSFESFQLDPQDYKLGSLFEDFSNVGGQLSSLIYADDLKLFHDTGKLFLMDAAATFLQNKNKESAVAKLWKETLESTLKSNECKEDAEPWHSMGVDNPKLESYLNFAQQRKCLNSIRIVDKILHIYKNVMETFLVNNKLV